jgi:hypothetical protein
MTYAAHESDGQISCVQDVALGPEIGETPGAILDYKPVRMSPHLITLMARLRDEPSSTQPDPAR